MHKPTPVTEVQFYKSSLCPRCRMTGKILSHLQNNYPAMSLTVIDVVTHPLLTWNSGIRMIPALKTGEAILAGVMLGEERIRDFLDANVTAAP